MSKSKRQLSDKDKFLKLWQLLADRHGWRKLGTTGNSPKYQEHEPVFMKDKEPDAPPKLKMFTTRYYQQQVVIDMMSRDTHHEYFVTERMK
jgi:hypothetical protein